MIDLDERLRTAGERFREAHAAPVPVDLDALRRPRRSQRWVAPLAAAVAVLAVAITVVAVARHRTGRPAGPASPPLVGTEWTLDHVLENGVTRPPKQSQREIVLRFDGKGGWSGSDGCNYFGGDVTVGSGTLTFSRSRSTLMDCAQNDDTVRRVVADGVSDWDIQGAQLHLTRADIALVFRVRTSIYPSDRDGQHPTVLVEGQQGHGDYRFFSRSAAARVSVVFESRDAPGSPWGTDGQFRPTTFVVTGTNGDNVSGSVVDGELFVWGIAGVDTARLVFRDSASGRETTLTRYPLPGTSSFQAFGGFVGRPAHGSTVTAFDAAGHRLGAPSRPYWP